MILRKYAALVFAGMIGLLAGASARAASLDQLAALETVARAELEGASICPETSGKLSPVGRNAVPMLIEARIREKWAAMKPDARLAFFTASREKECAVKCRCGIYAGWTGPESNSKFAEITKRLLDADAKSALDEKKVAKCAGSNREWACGHPVFRAIVREAAANAKESDE